MEEARVDSRFLKNMIKFSVGPVFCTCRLQNSLYYLKLSITLPFHNQKVNDN